MSIFLNIFGPTSYIYGVTDVIVTILNQQRFWQMLFAICYVMADVTAIVAYVDATIFICGRWNHIK